MSLSSRSLLTALCLLLLPLVLSGCGEEKELDQKYEELKKTPVPKGLAPQFNFDRLDLMFPKGSEEALLAKDAQIILDEREIHYEKLKDALDMYDSILRKLPQKSYGACQTEVSNPKYKPAGICNQWANIHAKKSEVHYYMGELHSIPKIQQNLFRQGKEDGEEGQNYNKFSVAALFWTASNYGSWLRTSVDFIWTNIWAQFPHREELLPGPKTVELLLLKAEEVDPDFRKGGIQRVLGRTYHKTPSKYLPDKDCPALAEGYLKRALKKNPQSHYAHFFLFEFYKDQGRVGESVKEAQWLVKNANSKDFSKKFPISARKELEAATPYLNEHQ